MKNLLVYLATAFVCLLASSCERGIDSLTEKSDNRRIISYTLTDGSDKIQEKTLYTYNDLGLLVEENNYNYSKTTSDRITYEYYDNGKLKKALSATFVSEYFWHGEYRTIVSERFLYGDMINSIVIEDVLTDTMKIYKDNTLLQGSITYYNEGKELIIAVDFIDAQGIITHNIKNEYNNRDKVTEIYSYYWIDENWQLSSYEHYEYMDDQKQKLLSSVITTYSGGVVVNTDETVYNWDGDNYWYEQELFMIGKFKYEYLFSQLRNEIKVYMWKNESWQLEKVEIYEYEKCR